MNARRCAPIVPLAVLGLAAACAEPAGPDRLASAGFPPAAAVGYDPDGGPLQVHAAVKVEDLGDESIRELVEVTAYFELEPVDPDAPVPTVHDIELELEVDIAGTVEPCWIVAIAGDAWAALDGGGFVLEAEGAAAVAEALEAQVEESGQVADLTDRIGAAEARLRFRADLKVWELRLELAGVDQPQWAGPPAFAPIAGAADAVLRIGEDHLASRIRENEAFQVGAPLLLAAETKIREAGAGEIRELVAIVARFPSTELVPDPQIREVEDLALEFELDIAGIVGPPCIRFVISGDGWEEGDGGGFKIIEPQWLQALVIREGQVLADLTGRIREVEASLNFLVSEKVWELRLEIGGVITPTDVPPAFSPIAGAGTATLVVGNELEALPAGLREAEAIFGVITPTD